MRFKNCVYRFIDNNDEVIYIGKAGNLCTRIRYHHHLQDECYNSTYVIQYCRFETKDDIEFMEKYYIAKYKPKYNKVYKNKDLTIEIEGVKEKSWKLYNINSFAKDIFIRSTEDIECSLNNIQIDVNIMDYYLMFTLEQNSSFNFYNQYKLYQRLNKIDKLELYKEEFDELENKNEFEKIQLLQDEVAKKVIGKIDHIFSKNKLLEYNMCLPQQIIKTEGGKLYKFMNLVQLDECINLSNSTFRLNIKYESKYYDISKSLSIWIKCIG
ncbi:hypothetical protein TPELB_14150 [Terrisporobacter petrolearius]|uniref:GIY-YIG domain-containing protein n=1 Tax=Terrisporobacter petrolearius TaxID=1460447 RepID=A0ABZ3FCL9_9FIRM